MNILQNIFLDYMDAERQLTFAAQIQAFLEQKAREDLRSLEEMLVGFGEKYDANLALLNSLGMVDQFNQAAKNIINVTKRRVEVIISPRPYISCAPDDPFHKYIKESSDCEIEFKWELPGTRGVEHKIIVKASDGKKVQIRSARGNLVFEDGKQLDKRALNDAIFEAYKHPLRSDQHYQLTSVLNI